MAICVRCERYFNEAERLAGYRTCERCPPLPVPGSRLYPEGEGGEVPEGIVTLWSIWDIDGCLSDPSRRLHLIKGSKRNYDQFHSECFLDRPRDAEPALLKAWRAEMPFHRVALSTGRTDNYRDLTMEWLHVNDLLPFVDEVHMRPEGDSTPSEILKRRIYREHFRDARDRVVLFVVEDTPKLVRMYRTLGLPVLQSISHREDDYDVSTSEG